MATFALPGEGWVEGPLYPPNLANGPIESIRYIVAQVGKEDVELIWHRYVPQAEIPTEPGWYVDQWGRASHFDGALWGVSEHSTHYGTPLMPGTVFTRLVPES